MLAGFSVVGLALLWIFSPTVHTTDDGIEVRRFGWVATVRWESITKVEVTSSRMKIHAGGVRLRIEQELTGYLELYAIMKQNAPADAFDAAPKLPFVARTSRTAFVVIIGLFAVLPGAGVWGLFHDEDRSCCLLLLVLGIGGGVMLLKDLVLRYEFGQECLRIVRGLRTETLPWQNLEVAQVASSDQAILALSFRPRKLIQIATSVSSVSPERIFEAMRPVWEERAVRPRPEEAAKSERASNPPWRRKAARILAWCAIPVAGSMLLLVSAQHQRSEWLAAVRKALPAASRGEIDARSLPAICGDPRQPEKVRPLCTDQRRMAGLAWFSVGTLGFTLAVVLAIWLASRSCGRDRRRLLSIFRPLMYGVGLAAILILLAQTVVFLTALSYGMIEFLDRVPSGLLLVTGLLAIIAVYAVARAMWNANRVPALDVDGILAEPQVCAALWDFTKGVAKSIGAAAPKNIVLGLAPTFFVTEAGVNCDSGRLTGRTLHLSLPLCRLLTHAELRAIVAHEMAHFTGRDTRFSRRFLPIYRGISQALERVQTGSWVTLPSAHLLAFFLECFAGAEAAIGRQREALADQVAARHAGAAPFASALTKLVLHAPDWYELVDQPDDINGSANWPLVFAERCRETRDGFDWPSWVDGLTEAGVAHPMDTHPPLRERLLAFGTRLEEVLVQATYILTFPTRRQA